VKSKERSLERDCAPSVDLGQSLQEIFEIDVRSQRAILSIFLCLCERLKFKKRHAWLSSSRSAQCELVIIWLNLGYPIITGINTLDQILGVTGHQDTLGPSPM